MWHYDDGWGAWAAMSVGMVVFWALVFVAVVAVVRSVREDRGSQGEEAARLLDERFARGDIDEQDYLARRDLLPTRR